jgi:hypothetical protein
MKDRKRHQPAERTRRAATADHEPDPVDGEPVEEIRLPPRNPQRGRSIEDPNPKRKNQLDNEIDGTDEDDDATGEMESAGQDLGLVVEDVRDASSVEDLIVDDEEADDIDHDDRSDRGRGQFD